jgi:hypothetical protein
MQRKLAAILSADVVGLSGHYALSYSNGSSDLNDSTSSAWYNERGFRTFRSIEAEHS